MKFRLTESFENNKVTGYPWKSFIKNIEETTNFLVDSAYKRRPDKWIELIDKNTKQIYDAEVTKYSDGTYELMLYNINKQFNEALSNESLKEEIFEFLEELGGYTDYTGRIEAVAEEFDISFDEAEGFVDEWIHTPDDEYEFDESLNEGASKLEIIKSNKKAYQDVSNYINTINDEFEKAIYEHLILKWLSSNNWLGGMSDSNFQKIYDKYLSDYSIEEVYDKFNEIITNKFDNNNQFLECLNESTLKTVDFGTIRIVPRNKINRKFDKFIKNDSVDEWSYYQTADGEIVAVENESSLEEDTVKTSDGKWTNKGEEGTHGKFKTKKEADAQRKAMFASGYKESLSEGWADKLDSDVYRRLRACRSRKSDIEPLVNAKWAAMKEAGKDKKGFTKEDALVSILELLDENGCYIDLTRDEYDDIIYTSY